MHLVQFAQKAFVVHEEALLAVRRSAADQNHPLCWEVPGGRLMPGESLDEHITREVREETGIEISPGEPVFVWDWRLKQAPPGTPDTVVAVARICSARTAQLTTRLRAADDDLDLLDWISLYRIHELPWIPNMVTVINAFLKKHTQNRP